jgi:DNA topoisomerase I
VVALLEATRIRIGNREYAEANHSYGLTTFLPQQVIVEQGIVRFVFKGKSGRRHRVELDDPRLVRIVARLRAVPGQELFQYADGTGAWIPIRSEDVNEYLREISGLDLTAKSFRTWSASVLALSLLGTTRQPSTGSRKTVLREAIDSVAEALGNTPTVCRASYVHPHVVACYLADDLEIEPVRRGMRWLSVDERRFLALLDRAAA